MKGCDFMAYKKTVDMLLKSYSDSGFELLEANSIDSNCVDIFENTYKNSIR